MKANSKGFTPLEVTPPSGGVLMPKGIRLLTGFTLIETLIYLALFSIIIGGGLVVVYGIIQGTDANFNKVVVEEEGNFLLRKINWALTGLSSIDSPLSGVSDSTLLVTKLGVGTLLFDVSGTDFRLTRGGGSAVPLNTVNVKVTNVLFEHIAAVGGKPAAVKASFTLTDQKVSQPFTTTKYLRK